MISKIVILALFGAVIAQDYQDFGNGQRAAPPRIRQGAAAQEPARQPPVAILKQINKHNEDGSYTYGYEGADGSFKIETKLATGEVKGKYGYVDETGKVRVVEYGANKYGFQPSGEGITVAPPTLVDETTQEGTQYEDDQPRPQKPFIARVPRPQPQHQQQHQPQQQPRPQSRPVQARPQYVDYDEESEPEQPRQQQYSPGPAPPRLQIPGAQPVDVVYSPNQRPARPDGEYTQRQSFGAGPSNVRISRPVFAAPQAGPTSRAQQFAPQQIRPVTEAIPQYQPRPSPQPIQYHAPQAPQGRSTSVLDQLAKDYALPQGGSQPLHDISFGYF